MFIHKLKLLVFLVIYLTFTGGISKAWSRESPLNKNPWFLDEKRLFSSAHGRFACSECHKEIEKDEKKHPDPEKADFLRRDVTRIYDYSLCKKCHPQEYEQYLKGVHAQALAKEKSRRPEEAAKGNEIKAPTCGNCHFSHYVKARLPRIEMGKLMTERCGLCHPNQKKTYLENYHGKTAVFHEAEASAYCSDCHGAHYCVSLKKKEAALQACRRCHPEAQNRFVNFVIHASTKDLTEKDREKIEKVKLINRVKFIGFVFVIGVLGFFYLHTILWFLRKMHEKLRERR